MLNFFSIWHTENLFCQVEDLKLQDTWTVNEASGWLIPNLGVITTNINCDIIGNL